MPACDENCVALEGHAGGNIFDRKAGVVIISLQYWIASCATPTWFAEENASSVGIGGSCCCTL